VQAPEHVAVLTIVKVPLCMDDLLNPDLHAMALIVVVEASVT